MEPGEIPVAPGLYGYQPAPLQCATTNENISWPAHGQYVVQRWHQGRGCDPVVTDEIAEEVPVALSYNGLSHVVMLATPLDIEDFALGFSLTEGIVQAVAEVYSIRVHHRSDGIDVRVKIPEERFALLPGKERNLTGRTGCGLCGSATLQQAVRHPQPLPAGGVQVSHRDLHDGLAEISGWQKLNTQTGAVHAAAWLVPGRGIVYVREDVGRHNALDKLIGVLARTGANRNEGYALVTSRASYEMVQKCAAVGIGMMAAMSAPTGLAIRLARETGFTLVGFLRDKSHIVYAHPQRLL
ncbi:formate dehydrogenase accessory sulfurtransferase FdhD [Candidatus Methylospira mobilis]|uniref:Sulfur carrier protein FdhD n=1 Tax=Candidatus Methylospira mobilis TaxID=1808979 RepID=A0A5Q0BM98_9GAMM|nr:formate dehydrogenase accessory sulfurtransferase FdhD [Candidatus Methylospira mobilis]QFY43344.1 formate dehydrogenase accessory sulfurtransferase FdhD [Candidatus Methylospira mobilis]WNV03439.1 formate dehydrogenase accessory sulfurtransferase FdhD [Candidatus Methylospira mobilis]